MTELAYLQQQKLKKDTAPRHIVPYFDHEFIKPTAGKLQRDVAEIVDGGFTNVVLCVTESDIAHKARRAFLKDAAVHMRERGLEVWADPWSVGNVFGGEGKSAFKAAKEKSCMCNPKLDRLMRTWLDTVEEVGIDTIFWDEPEMKCDDHCNDELRFLEKYTAAAGRLALASVVCLCANDAKKHQFIEAAHLPDVVEIATDPYFPNAFDSIAEADRLDYVAAWAQYTKEVADNAKVRSHIWVQTFNIPIGQEAMIGQHVAVCREQKMADIAIWGFHGCASVPNFHKADDVTPAESWHLAMQAINTPTD